MKVIFILLTFMVLSGCSGVYLKRDSNTTFDTLFFGTVADKTSTTLDANKMAIERFANRLSGGGQFDALGRRDPKFDKPSGFFYAVKIPNGETRKVLSPSAVDIGTCVEVISVDESEVEILRVSRPEKCT